MNSLRILLQEMYLLWCLDRNSLDFSDTGDRCARALALGNQIYRQQRARPAKPGLAVNGDCPPCCTLCLNKANELIRLWNRRRGTVGNGQARNEKPADS